MNPPLRSLGYDAAWDELFRGVSAPLATRSNSLVPGRMVGRHRHRSLVRVAGHPEPIELTLTGRLKHTRPPPGLPAVGDWLVCDPDRGRVVAVLPRRSALTRTAAGMTSAEQVLAANPDVVAVVIPARPAPNPRKLERWLTQAGASRAEVVVVVTKTDLAPDLDAALRLVADAAPGREAYPVAARRDRGLGPLRTLLADGLTVALLGASGAGKSTLTNALIERRAMAIGAVRRGDAKGRHTTSARVLLPAPDGGAVIDTPGVRELELSDAGAGLAAGFADVLAVAAACRFRDCRHAGDAGCAVAAAIAAGELAGARWESYRKLVAEDRAVTARRAKKRRKAGRRPARL